MLERILCHVVLELDEHGRPQAVVARVPAGERHGDVLVELTKVVVTDDRIGAAIAACAGRIADPLRALEHARAVDAPKPEPKRVRRLSLVDDAAEAIP